MGEYIEKWSVVNRLIEIENEFQQYKPFHGFEHAMYRKICEAEIAIGKTQTADVSPVRHGRWMKPNVREKTHQRRCTACGGIAYFCGIGCSYKYCPNCGAKMDEVSK